MLAMVGVVENMDCDNNELIEEKECDEENNIELDRKGYEIE